MSAKTQSQMDTTVQNYFNMINNHKRANKIPKPTDLYISTRSASAKISTSININELGIILARNVAKNILKKENLNYLIKGICMKNLALITTKKKGKKSNVDINNLEEVLATLKNKKRQHFYNQCSVIIKPDQKRRPINVKLFTNGSITLTGCLYDCDGYDAIKVLIEELKKYPAVFPDGKVTDIDITKYEITMINSNYELGFKINRIKLYYILLGYKYLVIYNNPEKYPGVKLCFFWNAFNKENIGICKCTKKCNGKGSGYGDGKCKKLTITIFQSGSILISGRTELQLSHAYKVVNSIFKKHYGDIIKFSIEDYMKQQLQDESNEKKKPTIEVIDGE
jgi:TATA-box binding protein (TBP) (component of TFIID and TFIIIB)